MCAAEPGLWLIVPFHIQYLPGGWILVHHTGVLEHVGPLAARACVAVLQMLSEVVRTVKLLGRVALSKLVHLLQVLDPLVPILVCGVSRRITTAEHSCARPASRPREFVAAVATGVSFSRPVGRVVEGPVISRERRA